MTNTFLGKAAVLTKQGFDKVLERLQVDEASLWALLTVETRGFGYLPDRRPKILYERHIFHKRTNGRFSAANPDISSRDSGGYLGGAAEYARLDRAIKLDRLAALESASWGLGQIMGFNASQLGYVGAEAMVASFLEGEDLQLDGAMRFITRNPPLELAFIKKKWASVAFFYNGKNFAEKGYDVKLERFCDLYTLKGTPSIELRGAQARLTFLGFDPRGVDGVLGDGTRAAVVAFQKVKGLPLTAELDDTTLEELKKSAGV
jgi:hypothetical protein